MYSSETFRFSSEEKMMEFLKKVRPSEPDQPIGIVGGHFMLLYDKDGDCLKPVIHQDLKDPKLKAFAKLMAEDFPVKSFDYSVELSNNFNKKGIKNGILLLVNDHQFQATDFQQGISKHIDKRGGILRKKFYRNKNHIPKSYQSILEDYDQSLDVLYNNNDIHRNVNALLPKETYFYSEQTLRNRFDKRVKPKLLELEDFYNKKSKLNSKKEFMFKGIDEEICLTEEGKCGCSLEVVEFLNNLSDRGIKNVIFFVPDECLVPVNYGTKVSAYFNGKYLDRKINFLIVGGLGGKLSRSSNKDKTIYSHTYL